MRRQMRREREPVAVALPWPGDTPAQVREQVARQGLYVLGIAARAGFLLALLYGTLA
jgi:hypothetical protein